MKLLKINLKYVIVVMVSVALFSCTKGEDGAIGAIGPAGPTGQIGPTGSDGQDGVDGADGTDGNANIIYSNWIDSTFPSNISSNATSMTISAPALTDEIRNSGVILVYGQFASGTIYALPVTFNTPIYRNSYFFRSTGAGDLSVRINSLDGGDIGDPGFIRFRYILMPGGNLAGKSAISKVELEKMSYEEVIAYFNIPE